MVCALIIRIVIHCVLFAAIGAHFVFFIRLLSIISLLVALPRSFLVRSLGCDV